MKCISVYTKQFDLFSDVYEDIINTPLKENEEKEFEGISVIESGEVPSHYLPKMRQKSEVVVMTVKDRNITILQHGELFEILIPGDSDEEPENNSETEDSTSTPSMVN